MSKNSLKDETRLRVGDLRQYASVRRIVLDDGPERGVRALAFSTGGGLDFWALADRSLDIGPLWYRGMPVAWQSPLGFRNSAYHRSEEDGGRGFERSFSGMLVTCGLDHIRQPSGHDPLHGRFPFSPARVHSYGESWDCAEPVLFCEGEITQWRLGGEGLRLRRRIEAPIGKCEVRIVDVVENLTSVKAIHQLLYHFNFGYPAISVGTEVQLGAQIVQTLSELPGPSCDSNTVCYAAANHPVEQCTIRSQVPGGGSSFQFEIAFRTDNLPWLQVWKDLRPQAGVLAIEPCTSQRRGNGQSDEVRALEPAEQRTYHLKISMNGQPAQSIPVKSGG